MNQALRHDGFAIRGPEVQSVKRKKKRDFLSQLGRY
jgi:hypothetical protein